MTGLEEEKTRELDIRLLGKRVLESLSVKQGIKYDSPESARDIPAFIQFYKLNCPYGVFGKLKPDARPAEMPDDPNRSLWIKGSEFAIPRLLGDAYKDQVERYAAALTSSPTSHRKNRRARAWAKVSELGARKAALGDEINGKEDRLGPESLSSPGLPTARFRSRLVEVGPPIPVLGFRPGLV
ncbi:hypothetical protein EDB92DRAFT_1812023 [Lactarius akahatsu]|uniref:Uncharacterized protein n=1 Tax=Lactarius akahatsu TaxID=416441 RepID=A0AAD4LRC3_9AGAM|nr:hypothetical protein EDB92DRAFT_1812023 [Lactarius akahatsu]